MHSPEMKQRMTDSGSLAVGSAQEEFASYLNRLRADIVKLKYHVCFIALHQRSVIFDAGWFGAAGWFGPKQPADRGT